MFCLAIEHFKGDEMNIRLVLLSASLFSGIFFTNIIFGDDVLCEINTNVAASYPTSVVFNAQEVKPPLSTYTTENMANVNPGYNGIIKIPCNESYNISATPNNTNNKLVHLPGTFAYVGNSVYDATGGGVSVTFPNDFQKIQ